MSERRLEFLKDRFWPISAGRVRQQPTQIQQGDGSQGVRRGQHLGNWADLASAPTVRGHIRCQVLPMAGK